MHFDGLVTRLDTLPLNHVSHVVAVANEFGYDLTRVLSEVGIGNGLPFQDSTDLPTEVYYQLLERILELIDIPSFGVRVGQKFSLSDYGVLGYACISSPNLRHLLQTFFRFQQIVGSDTTFREALRVEGDQAMIEIHSSSAKEQIARFDVEEAVGQWSVAAEAFFHGKDAMYTRVNLSFGRPVYAGEMEALLNCPVYYKQARNEMVFPAELLDEPILMANELIAQMCEQQCNTILQSLTQQEGLVDQVRKLIIKLPGQVPTPEEIAAQLNMSYRSLRRRLSEEGTSFKEIHNEVRMGMASEYMRQTDLTTQEITYLLGYSESSNFHRAFKAWFGKTPGEYRLAARESA